MNDYAPASAVAAGLGPVQLHNQQQGARNQSSAALTPPAGQSPCCSSLSWGTGPLQAQGWPEPALKAMETKQPSRLLGLGQLVAEWCT